MATSKKSIGASLTIEELMKLRTGTGEHMEAVRFDDLLEEMISLKEQVQKQTTTISALEAQAMSDPLTGLANRRTFEEEMRKSLSTAHRYERMHGLLMIDVNEFKAVNDKLGHVAGDAALKHIARLLRQNIRKTDIAARLGGDEFCVILNELRSSASAEERAKAIQDVIATTPLITEEVSLQLTVSVGHYIFTSDDALEDILHRADTEMYKDKARSRAA